VAILKISLLVILYLTLSLFLIACAGGYFVTNRITYYTPVYMSYADLRASFHVEAAHELHKPGKIAIYGNYIFLNEQDKGIHIIDNKNPRSPRPIAFLHIAGNYDLAIKDGYLFADSFIDIIVIDIGGLPSPHTLSLVDRLENVIPYNPLRNIGELLYDNHAGIFYHINEVDHSNGVVIDWETEVTYSKQWVPHGGTFSPPSPEKGTCITGSLARFAVKDDFLYTVDETSLNVLSLAKPQRPKFLTSQKVDMTDFILETIFSYNHYLFLGSTIGMYIFSLEKAAEKPEFIARLTHRWSHDPVVVHNNLAYVSLLMGELQIIDISNIREPKLLKIYSCNNPLGLSIDMPYLFINTKRALLVYDVTDPLNLKIIKVIRYREYYGHEVMAHNEHLFVITTKGLFQYDYSDIENIKLLSLLQIKQNHR
jgi:hypothetical protein